MPNKKSLPKAARPASKLPDSKTQKLRAEIEQLKRRVQELQSECARYREACRTWIVSRYKRDDIRRIVAEDDEASFQPLEQFVGELEAIVKGKRKKGA
jgi:DNA repair exonuclease SbcCD ATPase subunit